MVQEVYGKDARMLLCPKGHIFENLIEKEFLVLNLGRDFLKDWKSQLRNSNPSPHICITTSLKRLQGNSVFLKLMFSMKTKWVKFASSAEELDQRLGKKECVPMKVNSKAVLLVKHQDQYRMVKNKCPHQGITLENAYCIEGDIVCPWHHYGFNLEHGRGAGLYLEVYPIEKREDGYYAGFEKFSMF